jgi:hypothetical protein
MKVKVIDTKNLNEKQTPWGPTYYFEKENGRSIKTELAIRHQKTIPDDVDLLEKVYLKQNEKILVVAGFFGDWANALADAGCKVTYTDISKEFVGYCKKKFGDKFKEYLVCDYSNIPAGEDYDYTFSFEPVSDGAGSLLLGVIKSLINRKGIIIVHFPRENKPLESYSWMKDIAEIFGAEYSEKEEFIFGKEIFGAEFSGEKKLICGEERNFNEISQKHVIRRIITNKNTRYAAKGYLKSIKKANEDSSNSKFSDNKSKFKEISLKLEELVKNKNIFKKIKFIEAEEVLENDR